MTPAMALLALLAAAAVAVRAASESDGVESAACRPTIDCPALRLPSADGDVIVMGARRGEVPSVLCPEGTEYAGPAMECGLVGRTCLVSDAAERSLAASWGGSPDNNSSNNRTLLVSTGNTSDDESCWNQYNLTLRGTGLKSLPSTVHRRLLNQRCEPFGRESARDSHHPDVEEIASEDIVCRRQSFVGLDIGSAKVERSRARRDACSFQGNCCPWFLRLHRVAVIPTESDDAGEAQRTVDLLLCRSGDSPPETSGQGGDGVFGVSGRVRVRAGQETELSFRFVDSETDRPLTLSKFYITAFGVDQTQVSIDGFEEFYVASSSTLRTEELSAGEWRFSSGSSEAHAEGETATDASEGSLWQDLLDRSAAFAFARKSEFTVRVNPPSQSTCQDATEGDPCFEAVQWAMSQGIHNNPEWYGGLTEQSQFPDFQRHLYDSKDPANCMMPCDSPPDNNTDWVFFEFAGWSLLVQQGNRTKCSEEDPGIIAGFSVAPNSRGVGAEPRPLPLGTALLALAVSAVVVGALVRIGQGRKFLLAQGYPLVAGTEEQVSLVLAASEPHLREPS